MRENRPVHVKVLPMAEAIEAGADAFFDEKYGEEVRTVRVQDYSFELCGGTHCSASGQIGGFVITAERSIGAGTRRIEAVTGDAADELLRSRSEMLNRIAELVGAQSLEAVPDRIATLQEELRETRRRLRAGGSGLPRPAEVAAGAREVGPGVKLAVYSGTFESVEQWKGFARDVRSAMPSGVIAVVFDAERPQIFVTVSSDLVEKGIAAGDLVKAAMAPLQGKGGGRPEMAQGTGNRREGASSALSTIADKLKKQAAAT